MLRVLAVLALGVSAGAQVQSEQKLFSLVPDTLELFGGSLDVSGDRLIVGAGGSDVQGTDSGTAYVFRRSGSTWVADGQLLGALGAAGDQMGDVAIDGATAVVGAWRNDDPCAPGCDAGVAYVFRREATGWVPEATLQASDAGAGDEFGSVAISGDRIVVGARGAESSSPFALDAGVAYVFERAGTVWTQTQILNAADPGIGDRFGAVAIDGDVLAVGACKDDTACPGATDCDTGSVYVFEHDGSSFVQVAKLTASDGEGEDFFGESLSVSGGVIAVGACGADQTAGGAGLDEGAVYVFRRNGGIWQQEAILTASDGFTGDQFGFSVDLFGARLVVGATDQDDPARNQGAAYVFEYDGFAWVETQKLIAGDGETENLFGTDVAIDGRTIVCGAALDDHMPSGSLFAGSVYVYDYLSDFRSFCYGDGGISPLCTPCPCGNDAPAGTLGGCLNSVGSSARLYVEGMPSVEFDTLRFELEGGLPFSFGVLISGENTPPLASPSGCPPGVGVQSFLLDGLRCVNTNVIRHGPRGMNGDGDIGLDNNGWGPPSGPPGGLLDFANLSAGQTRYFQVFYREGVGQGCLTEQNTSNAVGVTLVP